MPTNNEKIKDSIVKMHQRISNSSDDIFKKYVKCEENANCFMDGYITMMSIMSAEFLSNCAGPQSLVAFMNVLADRTKELLLNYNTKLEIKIGEKKETTL
jgi:hypothetical protein